MRYVERPDTPKISTIGLGTWQFGSREWGYGDEYAQREAREILRRALDLGVTLIDSAEVYGLGRSERIVGEALGSRRDEAFVATKIFPLLPLAPIVEQRGVASARRLGVQRIDLYQVHAANPIIKDATIMRGMAALQDVGLVGDVGVSNYPLERWQAAERALGRPVLSNQVRYNLVERDPEQDHIPHAESHGRLVIAYSPLAQGLLTGRYDARHPPTGSIRTNNPMFLPENLERAQPLVNTLREVADAHDATPAQIALAWTIRSANVVAIPGASSVEQLESNVAASDIELKEGQIRALEQASDAYAPITGMAAVGRLVRSRVRSG